ncbi:MAG: phosphate signaling complex protein PhoU [Motiliproteus sp.]|nr:phosphate signaling complex protein PhoU [Motiliproteus sp.]MCW9054226.1 phosphate signaling complex protein PhoU [Motiliproteus sp.]
MEYNKDAHSDHISQKFNEELETMKSHLMTMGGLVEKQVKDSIESLIDGNSELAERAQATDTQTNEWEMTIDDLCTTVIARRQPAASDLRMIVAISKASNDLERIGDEAARIAKHAELLVSEGESPFGYAETRHIGNLVREMLNNALTAFARYDVELAYQVAKKDRQVDDEYKTAMRSLVTYMMEDPRSISRILNIIWVIRSLERIGDHSRNICQHLIYLVKGVNVSHSSLKQIEKTIKS